jgi:serine/threonine-protein kinase
MGVVYGAHDTLLDRPVAVKVLPAVGVSREGKSRLMREAKATARLNHPHIVSVYDAGETNGSPFIVMELVEGKTLREASTQSLVDSLNLIRQVCDALEHAHNAGIIHRDLKPENIVITPDQTVKLMDFGLALASGRSHLTEPGTLMGTFAYLAPELVMGQEAMPQSDLYALGVMMYELTTGRAPFVGDTLVAVISQHLNAPVVPPSTYNAAIPPALEQIIVRLLAKAPGERYGSAAEVLQALDKVQAELTGSIQLPVRVAVQTAQVTSGAILLDRMVRGRLVGRDKELAELRDFWNRAERGEGRMALLSGEPGIGKTRLAEELVVHARLRGALILKGHFHPELGLPYLEPVMNYEP